MAELKQALEESVRHERGRVIGGLMRLGASLDAAEEAFQEASLRALLEWGEGDAPASPGAWLMTVAKNRIRDGHRHRKMAEAKAHLVAIEEAATSVTEDLDTIADDHLRLILTCCHPELSPESQIALTLKMVSGFTMEEVARAFVTSSATVSQRILRAKQTIEEKKLAYALPSRAEMGERISGAIRVVYAIFNEGHTSHGGELMRLDLQAEALRLGRLLGEWAPVEPEVFGLIALMAFSAARARTRVDEEGAPILLADQDRLLWDRPLLREGLIALQRARSLGGRGSQVLQAEIAACHVTAPSWEATDWGKILALYDRLLEETRSPVVALNRAVAVSFARSPEDGLTALAPLESALGEYHLFHATRADLLERAGIDPRASLERALALVTNEGERMLLQRRLTHR